MPVFVWGWWLELSEYTDPCGSPFCTPLSSISPNPSDLHIQEWYPLFILVFHCEFYQCSPGIYLCQEPPKLPFAMRPDDEYVIHIVEPKGWFVICLVDGFCFEVFHKHKLAITGDSGEPIAAPVVCSRDFSLYWKYVDFKQNSVNWYTVCHVSVVLSSNPSSNPPVLPPPRPSYAEGIPPFDTRSSSALKATWLVAGPGLWLARAFPWGKGRSDFQTSYTNVPLALSCSFQESFLPDFRAA